MDQLEEFYKDSLEQIPRIGVTALILIPLLRTIILKDALSKVVTLGFALSLACQLNILKAKDIRIIYINNATLIFIGLVAISLIITRIILSASS